MHQIQWRKICSELNPNQPAYIMTFKWRIFFASTAKNRLLTTNSFSYAWFCKFTKNWASTEFPAQIAANIFHQMLAANFQLTIQVTDEE